jgi:hypothetical protein
LATLGLAARRQRVQWGCRHIVSIRVIKVTRRAVASPPAADWRAHPVIVALIAGGAAIAFWQTYVVPQQVQSLRNELEMNAELVSKAQATKEQAQNLGRELKEAQVKLASLEVTNLFSVGNPYPVGMGLVRIGQSIEDVGTAYPTAKLEKQDRYWRLPGYHAAFHAPSFHFDEKDKKITHALFVRSVKLESGVLRRKLVEALGPPTLNPKPDRVAWKLPDLKSTVYSNDEDTFVIMRDGYTPVWWPSK